MHARTGGVAALSVSVSIVAATAIAAPPDRTEIVVQVHDTSRQTAADQTAALRVASQLLAVTGTTVTWQICGQEADQQRDTCSAAEESGALIVRIMHAPRSARLASAAALGHALIDAGSGAGVLATIYFDRVIRRARQARVAEADLLGRAVAHELGHLLLSTTAHSATGLMRADWTKEELRVARASDWMFSASEIALIQAAGQRRMRRGTMDAGTPYSSSNASVARRGAMEKFASYRAALLGCAVVTETVSRARALART